MNQQPAVCATKKSRNPLSVWDLPASLLTQVHKFRKRKPKEGRERTHQAAVLAFIFRNRFATASQVQRRFTKYLPSDRTARRHLAEMQESLGYLDLVPCPSPLWPKIYCLSHRGMRKLKQAFQDKMQSWEPSANDRRRSVFSIYHVVHEIFTTEYLLSVHDAAQDTANIELLTIQRRSLARNPAFCLPCRCSGRIIPDALHLLRVGDRGLICTLVETDTGSMPLKAVTEKLRRYATWADSERGKSFLTNLYRQHGAANPQLRFRIAMICGGSNRTAGEKRLNSLAEIVDSFPPMIRNSIWGVTTTAIRDGTNILTDNIWRRIGQRGTTSDATHAFLVA